MPILADDVLVARLAADHHNLVVLLHAAIVRVDKDLAKAAGKGLVLVRVERLVAEENDAMLVERGADFRDHGVIEIVGDGDAADLGAASPSDGFHLDPAVAHALSFVASRVRLRVTGCNDSVRPSRLPSVASHDEVLMMASSKLPHPEGGRKAASRRTQDLDPATISRDPSSGDPRRVRGGTTAGLRDERCRSGL